MDCDIVRLVDLLDSWLVPIDYLTHVVPKTIWMKLSSDEICVLFCPCAYILFYCGINQLKLKWSLKPWISIKKSMFKNIRGQNLLFLKDNNLQ